MRRARSLSWLSGALLLGLLSCARPPRPAPRPKPPVERGPGHLPTLPGAEPGTVARGGMEGTFRIPGPQGNPPELWRVSGKIDWQYGAGGARAECVDAEAASQLEEIDATAKAGRLRYTWGTDEILLDRGLSVTSPSRHATLRAESAVFRIKPRRFYVVAEEGKAAATLTLADTVVEARRIEADMGLREVVATHLTARREGQDGVWTGKAETATVDEARNLQLDAPAGEIRQGQDQVTFTAPVAVWKPDLQLLNFNRGATLTRDGLTVRAEGATWQRERHRIVTRGPTRLAQGRLAATGRDGAIDLARGVASLHDIRSELDGMSLHAGLGEVDQQGVLTLHELHATLSRRGTTLTAATATYQPAGRKLTLPSGGTAVRDGATMSASRVVWDGRADRFTAAGQVKLTARGATVSGSTLQGPGDLSSATLTPCAAEGRAKGGRWQLHADRGVYSGGQVRLSQARGSFTTRGRTATATAPQVRYDAATQLVYFSGGFTASSPQDGIEVTAQRADYDTASGTFRAHGNVVATVRGLRVRDEHWVYHVGGDDQGRIAHTATAPAPPEPKGEAVVAERDPAGEREPGMVPESSPGDDDLAVGTGDRPHHGSGQGPAVRGPATPDH